MSGNADRSSPGPPVTLGYATPDADGVIDWLPEAERLIDEGAGPTRLRSLFPKSDFAARYFAKSMVRRHGDEQLTPDCVLCGQPGEWVIGVIFNAWVKPRAFEFRWSSDGNAVQYETVHALCETCVDHWVRRAHWANWVRRGGFVLFWLALAAAILGSLVARLMEARWITNSLSVYVMAGFWISFVLNYVRDWLWRSPLRPLLKQAERKHCRAVAVSGAVLKSEYLASRDAHIEHAVVADSNTTQAQP